MTRFLRISSIVLLLSGCGPGTVPFELRFVATWGGQALDCAGGPPGIALNDLRFYVSELAVTGTDGTSILVELGENGRWQGAGVALVDLEDGSARCENGTPDTNAVIVGMLPRGEYQGLHFTLGVPFASNHQDPLLAPPPLDDTTMHWHWRSGYKFFRAGFDDAESRLSVHLGSAGCTGSVQAIENCTYPNRVSVDLPFNGSGVITVDLRELARLDPAPGEALHCESGPASEICHALFPAFGLDPASGRPIAAQRLYALRMPRE